MLMLLIDSNLWFLLLLGFCDVIVISFGIQSNLHCDPLLHPSMTKVGENFDIGIPIANMNFQQPIFSQMLHQF